MIEVGSAIKLLVRSNMEAEILFVCSREPSRLLDGKFIYKCLIYDGRIYESHLLTFQESDLIE